MYIIIGLIRSSVLYAFILSAICGSFSMDFFFIYVAFIFWVFLMSKIKRDGCDMSELLFEALKHDILVPFLGVRSLVLILSGKYLSDPHEDHASLFLSQGIIEGVWGTLIAICLAITITQVL
jgi:hypothetical protein